MTGPSRSSVAVPRSTAVSTQQLRITLAGREHVVEAGTTAGAALAEAGLGEQQPGDHAVIAARVNGQLRDLFCPVADGDVIEPDNLKAIEARMRQIVKQGQRFSRRVVSDDDARAELAGEPYKLELIGLKGGSEPQDADESVEVGGAELTIYDNLNPGT